MQLDVRMACLDRALASLESVSGLWASADDLLVARREAVLETLRPLAECEQPVTGIYFRVRPEDDAARTEGERLIAAVDNGYTLRKAGRGKQFAEQLPALLERAEASSDLTAQAEVYRIAGLQERDRSKAEALFRRALATAIAGRNDQVATMAGMDLIGSLVDQRRFVEAGEHGGARRCREHAARWTQRPHPRSRPQGPDVRGTDREPAWARGDAGRPAPRTPSRISRRHSLHGNHSRSNTRCAGSTR